MPDELQTRLLVPTFKSKGDERNYNTYREVKLLEYAKKIVENMLVRRIRKLLSVDAMQFNFILGK